MIWSLAFIAVVALQRGVELIYARRNTRRLLASGATEVDAKRYPLFIVLHAGWLIALLLFLPHDVTPNVWYVAIYAVLGAIRIWAVRSLGPYWTTRLIVVPNVQPLRRGPYRFVSHPNYLVVIGEIAIVPLALHEPWVALTFSAANAVLLYARIRAENRTLAQRRAAPN